MPGCLAERYLSLTGEGSIVVLYIERETMGISEYQDIYTNVFLDLDSSVSFTFIPLKESFDEGELDLIQKAGGVIIGGGDTTQYQKNVVETELYSIIKSLYAKGVPVAGFSAGALIMPELCVISAKDNEQHKVIYKKGLGLLKDCIIAVHLLRWNDEQHLIKSVKSAEVQLGYGIDDSSGIYLENGQLIESEGYVCLHYGKKGK